jgi:hypothetical protein
MMADGGGVMRKWLCLAAVLGVAVAPGCSLTVPIFPPGATPINPPSCGNTACDDAATTDGAPEPDAGSPPLTAPPTTPHDPTHDPSDPTGHQRIAPSEPGAGERSILSP